jgi:hypothetical protein
MGAPEGGIKNICILSIFYWYKYIKKRIAGTLCPVFARPPTPANPGSPGRYPPLQKPGFLAVYWAVSHRFCDGRGRLGALKWVPAKKIDFFGFFTWFFPAFYIQKNCLLNYIYVYIYAYLEGNPECGGWGAPVAARDR